MAEIRKRLAQAAFYFALAVALLGAIALPAMAAETPCALLTVTDGPVHVLRGSLKFDASEGFCMADDDIVRTAPSTRVARIEFADGRALDLGPATQLLLLSERASQARDWNGATAVLLNGWAKLSAGAEASRLVLTHGVVVGDARGVLLVHSAADGAALAFAESRGLTLLPRGAGAEVSLREGESWSRDAASGAVRVSARLNGLREVPRALADTLPRRAKLFDGRSVEASDGVPIEATELAPWSLAEPQLLAQLRPQRSTPAPRKNSTWSRRSNAVKTASHSGLRVATRRLSLPSSSTSAAAHSPAIALPATVFLAAEPVTTVVLPNLPKAQAALSPVQAQ